MKKYIRFIGIAPIVTAFYWGAWISNRPKVWHDMADGGVCFLLVIIGGVITTAPFEWPWEEK